MGSRFKNRGVGSIEADEGGSAEAGAAGEVDCFDIIASAMAQGIARPTPTASSHEKRRATLQKARMSPSQNSWGKIEPCSAVRGGF